MPDIEDAREITVAQNGWGNSGRKDFRPIVEHVDPFEVAQVEEAMTPVPKDSIVLGPAPWQESKSPTEPPASEVPVPVAPPLPPITRTTPPMPMQTVPQVAEEASGQPSGSSVAESTTSPTPNPAPAPSTPSGSSATNPGKNTPPAAAQPPTSA